MADDIRSIYATALKNAHAVELEALQIMGRQVERLQRYPEMERILRRHIDETHQQRDRLEAAMAAVNESPSALKEGVMGVMGNLAALAHTPAQDEILKNTFANHAFENFEIAVYKSLLVITEAAGQSRYLSGFETSLKEEQTMAKDVAELIDPTTRRYIELTTTGATASH
ncbi:MAG: ferritin-like domain-containing protein [Methylobacterium sp.]|uniref:ferritin-like domain-containing protein n=1 Tax=Methylobacterium sp. TaxID=409 RepID=UPI0025D1BC01|nr:ferritin-like domain-containing protein [Methylobacterium sp.]MBX9932118.1 ferritin-like domain-containing protein [Methylobacterium sp.]